MAASFLGIYTAIYTYVPQSDQELALNEGDLLYVTEKSTDDDWWKAKKKSNFSDDDEPIGLVPSTYIEEAKPVGKYKALYDYVRQTEEEVSFTEDSILDVYDITDPDWALVGYNGEYGFAPVIYVEKIDGAQSDEPEPAAVPDVAPAAKTKHVLFSAPPKEEDSPPPSPTPHPERAESSSSESPAAAVAAALQKRSHQPVSAHRSGSSGTPSPTLSAPPASSRPERPLRTDKKLGPISTNLRPPTDSDDSDGPRIPIRRPGEPRHGAKDRESSHGGRRSPDPPIPPGFQTFPVQEVDNKKKRAAILGLGPTRIILLPDKSSRPKEEWSVEHLTGYNSEGKHIFMELEKPSRSLDLHAGSKDAAEGIISALAEVRGAFKSVGLSEILAAASSGGNRKDIGTVLYDFAAQGEDEVSVTIGDEVIILDDTNDEWWLVRRQVNGVEGVVPSSYIERGRSKTVSPGIMPSPGDPRERVRSQEIGNDRRTSGIPQRTSSLAGNNLRGDSRRGNSVGGSDKGPTAPAKPKPDSSQVRIWTDRTGSFKVEAQFLGCREGKIHLHKLNGVKIAVPVSKMSVEDLEYVEKRTGISLDEDKPLAPLQRNLQRERQKSQLGITVDRPGNRASSSSTTSPSSVTPNQPKKDDYDWFEFFLSCGVDVNNCQRYETNFKKESMDESVLPDITAEVMRTLGLKEGDILRVMKKVDEKYCRPKKGARNVSFGAEEVIDDNSQNGSASIFSGPGGALKNNTSRKTRPTPTIQTPDVVDPKAFSRNDAPSGASDAPVPISKDPPSSGKSAGGFDDDAWSPKPLKTQSPPPQQPQVTSPPAATPSPQPAPTQQPAPTGAMQDLFTLTLNTPPLQPTVVSPPPQPAQQPPAVSQPPAQFTQQPTGFMAGNIPNPPPMPGQFGTQPGYMPQAPQTSSNQFAPRARPLAPMMTGVSTGLSIPPPPTRPLSAPNNYIQQNGGQNPTAPMLTPSYTGQPQQSMMNYAPLGQSGMMQQQPPPMMNMQTGYSTGYMQSNPTGMSFGSINGQPGIQQPLGQHPMGPGFQPPMINQPTGMMGFGQPGSMGVNSFLPPAMVPQNTNAGGLGIQKPLMPQQTGPAPNIRFGVQGAKKLAPQPTGKADLSKATPANPFGF